MVYLALAGPLLALGFLLVMQELERRLARSLRREGRPAGRRAGSFRSAGPGSGVNVQS